MKKLKVSQTLFSIQYSEYGSACAPCRSYEQLLDLKNGSSVITLSIGEFADPDFYDLVKKTASEHGTLVHIAPGGIVGFGVLRTVSLMEKVL